MFDFFCFLLSFSTVRFLLVSAVFCGNGLGPYLKGCQLALFRAFKKPTYICVFFIKLSIISYKFPKGFQKIGNVEKTLIFQIYMATQEGLLPSNRPARGLSILP